MSHPKIHSFDPAHDPSPIVPLLQLLRTYFPLSLPLYRRIQFAHFSSTTRIILSFPPSVLASSTPPPTPWLAAYSDPERGPETQIFSFGSWEVANPTLPAAETRSEHDASTTERSLPEHDETVRALLHAFLSHVKESGLYLPTGTPGREKHLALLGSVHESTARILHGFGVLDPAFVDGQKGPDGLPERYNKWVFDLRGSFGWRTTISTSRTADIVNGQRVSKGEGFTSEDTALPAHLRWGQVRQADYALVRSRTGIPRQDRTLSMLPSVAIFRAEQGENDAPVAWTFLGVDSSLTTLHVEAGYRGQGLAKKLALKVWQDHLGWYTEQYTAGQDVEERWAHADVAESNDPSNGVCRSLSGVTEWGDYWFRADLDMLPGIGK